MWFSSRPDLRSTLQRSTICRFPRLCFFFYFLLDQELDSPGPSTQFLPGKTKPEQARLRVHKKRSNVEAFHYEISIGTFPVPGQSSASNRAPFSVASYLYRRTCFCQGLSNLTFGIPRSLSFLPAQYFAVHEIVVDWSMMLPRSKVCHIWILLCARFTFWLTTAAYLTMSAECLSCK